MNKLSPTAIILKRYKINKETKKDLKKAPQFFKENTSKKYMKNQLI